MNAALVRLGEYLILTPFVYLIGENEEIMLVEESAPTRKRKAEEPEPEAEEPQDLKSAKRARISSAPEDGGGDDDIIVL